MARKIYDISQVLSGRTPVYPGDPPLELRRVLSFAKGDDWNLTEFSGTVHAGTHLDAPAHRLPDGATLDTFPPERFILPAVVADAGDAPAVGPEALAGVEVGEGEGVLFRTSNSATRRFVAVEGEPPPVGIAPAGARECVRRGVSLVGLDAQSVDPPGDERPAHEILLGAGVLLLEGADLAHVPPGRYTLICLPLRLAGAEGSPTRAVLIAPPLP